MESPYYEMTHDFDEENRLIQSGYVKGYHDAMMKYPEIVRCKDCKYHDKEDGKNFCDCGNRPDDWFCADGEKKSKI